MPDRINPLQASRKIRLLYRREKWTLTLHGWALIFLCVINFMLFTVNNIQPFLAVNAPIKADILVVEGWLPDYAIKKAVTEFKTDSYRQIVTTGIPLDRGYYLTKYKSFAELAAATLMALGLEKQQIVAIPAPDLFQNRTYASAVALRDWLSLSNSKVKSINLFTFDVHACRNWLIFEQVLAPNIQVGVIAAQSLEYDSKSWWSSSEGIRSVFSEAIAYLYARLIDWRN